MLLYPRQRSDAREGKQKCRPYRSASARGFSYSLQNLLLRFGPFAHPSSSEQSGITSLTRTISISNHSVDKKASRVWLAPS